MSLKYAADVENIINSKTDDFDAIAGLYDKNEKDDTIINQRLYTYNNIFIHFGLIAFEHKIKAGSTMCEAQALCPCC